MKPQKALLALILIVGLGAFSKNFFAWLHTPPQPEPQTISPAPLPPAPQAPPPITLTLRRPPTLVISPIRPGPTDTPTVDPSLYRRKPQGNVVEFKIVNGLAVTYGDVVLGKPSPDNHLKQGLTDAPAPHPWERPDIPYAISKDLPNPERVEQAIAYLRTRTPINFIPYSGQVDAVLFQPGPEHCMSPLGKLGGIQPIYLAEECQMTEILHEIMHTLGFPHEQSRTDRDQYVQILWDNIDPVYQSQYAIIPDSYMTALKDSPFDYHSVMLYHPHEFALTPELFSMITSGNFSISPVSQGLSDEDIKRIYHLFNL